MVVFVILVGTGACVVVPAAIVCAVVVVDVAVVFLGVTPATFLFWRRFWMISDAAWLDCYCT